MKQAKDNQNIDPAMNDFQSIWTLLRIILKFINPFKSFTSLHTNIGINQQILENSFQGHSATPQYQHTLGIEKIRFRDTHCLAHYMYLFLHTSRPGYGLKKYDVIVKSSKICIIL